MPQGDVAIDPITGVVAADRTDAAPEVFAVELTSGLVLGARRDSTTGRWTPLQPLTVNSDAGTGAVVTTPARRTGRLAAVRRTPGRLDLCWADVAGSVQTASSAQAARGPGPLVRPTRSCGRTRWATCASSAATPTRWTS